jgi:ankyrin repeat protein
VNSADIHGRTLLSYAAQGPDTDILKFLLGQENVEVNSVDEKGMTSLMHMAVCGNSEGIKILLKHGNVNINIPDNTGRTALSHAAATGFSVDLISLLSGHEDIEFDTKDKDGRTPLSHAAEGFNIGAVKLLFELGSVEVESKDKKGRTPLHHAVKDSLMTDTPYSVVEVVGFLLERGADVNAKDDEGNSPLILSITRCIRERNDDQVTKLLLAQPGVDVNWKAKFGMTVLSFAAIRGHADAMGLLLEKGADVNAIGNSGYSPLMLSISSDTPRYFGSVRAENFTNLLAQSDIDVNWKAGNGMTALSLAIRYDLPDTVELLRQHGAV